MTACFDRIEKSFGEEVMLLGEVFKQVLHIIIQASISLAVTSCIKIDRLWTKFHELKFIYEKVDIPVNGCGGP
jgi:hypothetical protein